MSIQNYPVHIGPSPVRVQVELEQECPLIDSKYVVGDVVDISFSRVVVESNFDSVRRFSIPFIQNRIDALPSDNVDREEILQLSVDNFQWYDEDGETVFETDDGDESYLSDIDIGDEKILDLEYNSPEVFEEENSEYMYETEYRDEYYFTKLHSR